MAFQALEFGTAADTFVDTVFSHTLQEERAEDSGCDDKEDAGAEPRSGGLLRVGITGRELSIDFHAADKTYDSADGIDEFGSRVEIGSNHVGGFDNTANTVALGIDARTRKQQQCCKNKCFFHDRKQILVLLQCLRPRIYKPEIAKIKADGVSLLMTPYDIAKHKKLVFTDELDIRCECINIT